MTERQNRDKNTTRDSEETRSILIKFKQ